MIIDFTSTIVGIIGYIIILFILAILCSKIDAGNQPKDAIERRLRAHYKELEKRGYEIVCLCLQGSQNYGLDEYSNEYQSDVDSKAIVLPTFKDFVYNKSPVSTTIVLDNNEHIDVKDIRVMFDMFKKENISYIELLYTKYKIINPKYKKYITPVFENREAIAALNTNQFVRCIAGMSMEKRKALCHPYPNLIEKIEKYGFDGKQLSHCVRLNNFLYKYMNNCTIADCFDADSKEELMNYKKQLVKDGSRIMTKEEAIELCDAMDQSTAAMKELIISSHEEKIDYNTIDFLNKIKYNILKKKFKEDLKWL
ncbi:MAG: hypothetical protein ACI4PE_03290 [Bacilli bacterium]